MEVSFPNLLHVLVSPPLLADDGQATEEEHQSQATPHKEQNLGVMA